MSSLNLTPAYDEFLDYLVRHASAEDILAFKPSTVAQERAEYLTDTHAAGVDGHAKVQAIRAFLADLSASF